MLQTLVLNVSQIPISIVPYRKILTRVRLQTAVVLKSYENTCITSAGGFSLPIPSVIQCVRTNYIPKFTKNLPFNRKNLFIRDHGVCQYCGKKVTLNSMSFDHVIPRMQGGKTVWNNIVLACLKCNSKKGAQHPEKYKWPFRMPYAPQLSQAAPIHIVNKIAAEIPHETWQDYLYWHVILEP